MACLKGLFWDRYCLSCTYDLPKSSAFYSVLYADDACLCLSHKNLDNLQHMVNVEVIKVDNWFHSNKLSLNYSKSTIFAYKIFKK